MTFFRGSYARRAEKLVLAMQQGKIDTPGKLAGWVNTVSALPAPLREWIFATITPIVGTDGISYIRSLLPEPIRGAPS